MHRRHYKKFIASLFVGSWLLLSTTACTALFFHPSKTLLRTPGDLQLDYEDVFIETRDGVSLHGWWIQPPVQSDEDILGRVLFLHGNAENISTHIGSVLWLLQSGYQVFALDYRGYGLSGGTPDIPNVFEDIRSSAQWLATQPSSGPSILFAQSLGASLAMGALHRFPQIGDSFDGLISEAAFSEYDLIAREVAGSHWLSWPLSYPASWLIASTYDPILLVNKIDIPIAFVHSVDDRIIGIDHAHKLYAAANEPKQLIETTGGHIQAVRHANVRKQLLLFMANTETPTTLNKDTN